MANKTFSAVAVGGVTTGTLLVEGGFGDIHEVVEHLLGRPVWTHEMASPDLWADARAVVLQAYPDFPVGHRVDFEAVACELAARYPDGVSLPKGGTQ